MSRRRIQDKHPRVPHQHRREHRRGLWHQRHRRLLHRSAPPKKIFQDFWCQNSASQIPVVPKSSAPSKEDQIESAAATKRRRNSKTPSPPENVACILVDTQDSQGFERQLEKIMDEGGSHEPPEPETQKESTPGEPDKDVPIEEDLFECEGEKKEGSDGGKEKGKDEEKHEQEEKEEKDGHKVDGQLAGGKDQEGEKKGEGEGEADGEKKGEGEADEAAAVEEHAVSTADKGETNLFRDGTVWCGSCGRYQHFERCRIMNRRETPIVASVAGPRRRRSGGRLGVGPQRPTCNCRSNKDKSS